MKRLGVAVTLFVALTTTVYLRAQPPSFAGTWKLNLAKSQLSGQTLSVEKTSSGMHFDSQGFAYDFDLSGKDFPTPDGGSASWKELNPNAWEATIKLNGKVIATYSLALKGDALTAVMKATKPEGGSVEQTSMWSRVSGGSGFLGKWKSTEVKGAATTMEIALDGAAGITVRYPEFQVACKGSLDGKDYGMTGAGANLKQTLAFEKTGANAIKMTTKLNGKPFYIDVLTLSADGQTLTDEGTPVAVKEPVKAVYDRSK